MESFKQLWALIYGVAVVAMGAVGTFLTPPPFTDAPVSSAVAKFTVGIAAGLFWAFAASKRNRLSTMQWLSCAVIMMLIALLGFATYTALLESWTSPMGTYPPLRQQTVVIGSRLNGQGRHAETLFEEANHRGPTPAELMEGTGIIPWEQSDIDARTAELQGYYVILALLFSTVMFITVQALSSLKDVDALSDRPGSERIADCNADASKTGR